MDHVDGTGAIVTGPGPGIGQIRRYGVPGEGAFTIVAPADFVPTLATDRELAVYGYPPRPSSGDDRALREKSWGHNNSEDRDR